MLLRLLRLIRLVRTFRMVRQAARGGFSFLFRDEGCLRVGVESSGCRNFDLRKTLERKGATPVAFGAWSAHILGHGAIHLPLVGTGAR